MVSGMEAGAAGQAGPSAPLTGGRLGFKYNERSWGRQFLVNVALSRKPLCGLPN